MAGMTPKSKLSQFVGDKFKDILNHPILADNDDLSSAMEALLEAELFRGVISDPDSYMTAMKLILIVTYYKGFLAGKETKALEDLPDGSTNLS